GRGPKDRSRRAPAQNVSGRRRLTLPGGGNVRVSMALIADEANVSQEGKLNVLGAFDRIVAPDFPMVHPKMVFIFRIEAGYGDGGVSVPVRIRLMDEDGGTLFETSGD